MPRVGLLIGLYLRANWNTSRHLPQLVPQTSKTDTWGPALRPSWAHHPWVPVDYREQKSSFKMSLSKAQRRRTKNAQLPASPWTSSDFYSHGPRVRLLTRLRLGHEGGTRWAVCWGHAGISCAFSPRLAPALKPGHQHCPERSLSTNPVP